MGLDFEALRKINADRCREWHGPDWLDDDDPWTLADWSNAMSGEAGEAANVVKKLRRWQTGLGAGPGRFPGCTYERMQAQLVERAAAEGSPVTGLSITAALFRDLADELADVVLYADLLATKAGINLGDAVRDKFNRKSAEQSFPQRL